MKRITAKQAQSNLDKVIEEAAAAHEPVRIDDDSNAIQETLYLLSIPGMRESILEAAAEPIESCSETVHW
jgi:PHD/YefM family antitoxin component YafN of YafNO toxin-antitoxin module